jgi:hypothetical protein
MKRFFKLVPVFLIVSVFLSITSVIAQAKHSPKQFPIIFSKPDSSLPDSMEIIGHVVNVSFTSTHCGDISLSGTLKIKLDKKVPNYPYNDLYIVSLCFPDFDKFGRNRSKYLGKRIGLNVHKFFATGQAEKGKDLNDPNCVSTPFTENKINSHGVPFYCSKTVISTAIENFKK